MSTCVVYVGLPVIVAPDDDMYNAPEVAEDLWRCVQ